MKKKLLLILVALSLLLTACGSKMDKISKTEYLMDTVARIDIYNNKDEDILKEVFDSLFQLEKTMSKTIKTSDISRINQEAGQGLVEVDEDTYYLVNSAVRIAEETAASFEPTIGPLVSLWDIKSGERERDWLPDEEAIKDSLEKIDYRKIEMDQGRIGLREEGMALDLGGIAKGFGADRAREVLLEKGVESAIVDLGGNIYALGEKPDKTPWKVGIKDPMGKPDDYLGVLELRDKSIVTSGDYERFFILDSRKYHHILDPKTGYPSDNDLASVTIVADSSMEADALATALYIMGREEGLRYLENNQDLGAIFVTKAREIYLTDNLRASFNLSKDANAYKIIE